MCVCVSVCVCAFCFSIELCSDSLHEFQQHLSAYFGRLSLQCDVKQGDIFNRIDFVEDQLMALQQHVHHHATMTQRLVHAIPQGQPKTLSTLDPVKRCLHAISDIVFVFVLSVSNLEKSVSELNSELTTLVSRCNDVRCRLPSMHLPPFSMHHFLGPISVVHEALLLKQGQTLRRWKIRSLTQRAYAHTYTHTHTHTHIHTAHTQHTQTLDYLRPIGLVVLV